MTHKEALQKIFLLAHYTQRTTNVENGLFEINQIATEAIWGSDVKPTSEEKANELKSEYSYLKGKADIRSQFNDYGKEVLDIGIKQGYLQALQEIEKWVKNNSMAMSEDDLTFYENAVDSDELLDFINQLKTK